MIIRQQTEIKIYRNSSIDWGKIHAIWDDDKKDSSGCLADLYYKGNERFTGKKEIDYRKIFYDIITGFKTGSATFKYL
jgi:hypothetical protein